MESKSLLESESDIFNQLSEELKFIIDMNGDVLEMNEKAVNIFGRRDSFSNYFPPDQLDNVRQFFSEMKKSGFVKGVVLFHQWRGMGLPILYNGKFMNHTFFLSGRIEEGTDAKKVSKMNSSMRMFLESKIDLAIAVINHQHNTLFINHKLAALFQLDEEVSVKGNSFSELGTDHPLKDYLNNMVEETKVLGFAEGFYDYREEALFYVQGVFCKEDGCICLFIHDRSYQHRFEKMMLYKQQMESVSQLAAGVAHELRNPLSVIRGFLQLSSLTNDWKKYYDTIISEITRMNEIIEDFLSVSRKKISKKIQKPDRIFQSLIYIIRSECLLHNIIFEYDIQESTKESEVNEAMVKQIMLNLLRNSVEAFDDQKEIRRFVLHAEEQGDMYVVKVSDNGPGMTEQVLKQLGKPFFTTKESGNGIGIPLCKNIIENHGGTFDISSQLGVGTVITFTLPLISKDENSRLASPV